MHLADAGGADFFLATIAEDRASLSSKSPIRYYLMQEPGAVVPLAGICAGGRG